MTTPINITRPIVDPSTGAPTQYGWRILQSLWRATGGTTPIPGAEVLGASVGPVAAIFPPRGDDVSPVAVSAVSGADTGPVAVFGGFAADVGPVGAVSGGSADLGPVDACCPVSGDVGPV